MRLPVKWQTELPLWLVLCGMFLLAAVTWSTAPDQIPVHWNVTGEVDQYGGRFEGLLLLPLVALAIYLVMLFIPRIDPGRDNYPRWFGPYMVIRTAILVLMALLYGLLHLWLRGHKTDVTTFMPILIGGFFIVLGSVMGKIRPNWFFGIRTPWTLSSKLSWSKTHRLGGWLMILAGVITMGAGALRPTLAFTVMIAGLIVTMVPLVVYSYIVWRNDPDKFPPAGTAPSEEI